MVFLYCLECPRLMLLKKKKKRLETPACQWRAQVGNTSSAPGEGREMELEHSDLQAEHRSSWGPLGGGAGGTLSNSCRPACLLQSSALPKGLRGLATGHSCWGKPHRDAFAWKRLCLCSCSVTPSSPRPTPGCGFGSLSPFRLDAEPTIPLARCCCSRKRCLGLPLSTQSA